jgi:hypothetical protein
VRDNYVQACIGSTSGNHVIFRVVGMPDQEGWVNTEIDIQAGFWRGVYVASLQAEDFPLFRQQLQALYSWKDNVAQFSTIEEWLTLKLTLDHHGHVRLEGTATDEPGTGNVLAFHLDLDQSYLPQIITELESVERALTAA